MSRCFPFPPPGYEKKARTDEVDLLNKEKQKEKKHKKEKRDKEKRESKEKREKEGRDGKHKEKKDKKEKHREKKKDKDKEKEKEKDKDKGRDRDKSKISAADKGFPGQAEGPNAGKLHQKEIKQNDKKGILFEEKPAKQYAGNNGEKARQNNHLAEENKDSKFLLKLDRMIKDDNGGARNQLVQLPNADQRKDEANARFGAKGSGTWPDGKEKLKDKTFEAKKIDGKGTRAEARPIANATVQNHAGNFHPRVDGMPKILEKNRTLEAGNFHPKVDGMPRILENNFDKTLEARIEGKEKIREKKDEGKEKVKEKNDEGKEKVKENKDEGKEKVKEKKDEGKEKVKEKKDDKRGDKRKDKEKEKKGHGKDKDRDKEKKKKKREEKAMEHSAVTNIELNKVKESNKAGHIGLNSFPQVSKNSHDNAVSGENPKKRKDIESNGVPRANDNWPSKLPRPSPSHPLTENGRILEPCQISIPNASDRPVVAATSVKVENKECKINGIIEAPPRTVSSNKTHTATVPADPVTEAAAKPPHPDTKYLSQVYLVPKIEEWSGFDDQEWLFGSSISQERKPAAESSEVGVMPQVWAEGLHIEPADVFALPYVIPY